MRKLLATDLDGTLLKNDKTVSEFTINKVHEMINEGHYFVIATGRPFFRITKILNQLNIISDKIYCICNNGGLIISTDGSKVLYEENMPHENAVELIDLAIKHDVNMLVYQRDYISDFISEYNPKTPPSTIPAIKYYTQDAMANYIFDIVILLVFILLEVYPLKFYISVLFGDFFISNLILDANSYPSL